ncbi:hypothetical protein [Pollutibacter soli]|uniref:hypothetical protein n=1 Tax=Pollutibacter soli TaxID=3034157 RepID=UPI003013D2C1
MKTLSQTWFAEGYIDFELKKYTLLSYLQEIHRHFDETKLYPQLADLIFHYNNMRAFRQNKEFLKQQFPKKFTQMDMQKLEMLYEQITDDDEMMRELEEIMHFALEKMSNSIQDGTQIYEFIEDKLRIFPVGLIPLENVEGYFLLNDGHARDTRVFHYRMSMFEKHDEKYRTIRTSFIAQWERNFVNTLESIKSELIRNRTELPNPAVYGIETDLTIPLEETLLPIAKRCLVKYIGSAA